MDTETIQKRLGTGLSSGLDIVAAAEAAHATLPEPALKAEPEEEEL